MKRRVLRMIPSVRSGSLRRLGVSAVLASALVVLIPSAAAALGTSASGSAASTVGASVTVTVTISGAGWVESFPPGISCGSTCSAQFPDGTLVSLGATPAIGSAFDTWSAAPPYSDSCPQPISLPLTGIIDVCWLDVSDSNGNASVHASFSPGPLLCTVPRVAGKTLAKAEALLLQRHCGVGNVKYAFSLKVQKGRVISQSPSVGWQREEGVNANVNLVVGKGRR